MDEVEAQMNANGKANIRAKDKAVLQGTRTREDQVQERFKVARPHAPYERPSEIKYEPYQFSPNLTRGPSGIGPLERRERYTMVGVGNNNGATNRVRLVPPNASPPPPAFDHRMARRGQEVPINREHKRDSTSVADYYRQIYGNFMPARQVMTIPEEDEEEARVDLPAYDQAYNNSEPAAPPQQSSNYTLKPPPGLRLPGLGQLATIGSSSTTHAFKSNVDSRPSEPNFVPISKTVLFPNASPSPPRQLSPSSLLDALRTKFDTKLSLLEERLERKIGTDAQSLSTIRDLEARLKESEAEKEEYKKKIADLEKKAAMLKGWRE